MLRSLLGPVLLLALLGGCTAIGNVRSASRARDTFELTPLAATSTTVRGSRHLAVEPPQATGALATERIAVRPNRVEIAYLYGAQWADTAPRHLQFLLARSLVGTGGFAMVSTEQTLVEPDWHLATDLEAFQVEIGEGGAPQVRVRVRATLISDDDRRIRGARSFERSVPAADTSVAAVIPAFDAATGAVLREIADWTLATAR